MEPYHDRVPVLLEAKDFDAWLGSLGLHALKPAPAEALRNWRVSPRLNRIGAGDDDPTIPSRPSLARVCGDAARGGFLPLTIGARFLAFAHETGETDAGTYRRGS
jgi:hypothetical protein